MSNEQSPGFPIISFCKKDNCPTLGNVLSEILPYQENNRVGIGSAERPNLLVFAGGVCVKCSVVYEVEARMIGANDIREVVISIGEGSSKP